MSEEVEDESEEERMNGEADFRKEGKRERVNRKGKASGNMAKR